MFASFVAYLAPPEKLAASSAVSFMVANNKLMKLSWFETLAVLKRKAPGLVSAVEKKERLEYRTMHSSYQDTACLDKEHSESEESFCVTFATHLLHVEVSVSPLHMKSPYTVSEEFRPVTVLLWKSLLAVALEDREEKRVLRFDWKVLLVVVLLVEQNW